MSSEEMADGHRFQPGRSASKELVGVGELHKTTTKINGSSPERRSASSSALRPPAVRDTGRNLEGLCCNFHLFQGCSCKSWAVITKKVM
jgi:hypothetical protein